MDSPSRLEATARPVRPIGVFHPGTQHSWQTARALQDVSDLGWYATSIFWIPKRFPYRVVPWLPGPLRRRVEAELRRFHHPALDPQLVRTHNGPEWAMRLAARAGLRRLAARFQARSNTDFARPVTRLLAREPVRAVWGYDLSSLEVFRAARAAGVTTILDRTIGHPATYNRVMEEVYDAYPAFFRSPDWRIDQATIDRADAEHALADRILVGSDFCAATLREAGPAAVDPARIEVVAYCFDDHFFAAARRPLRRPERPIRFLFTGLAGPRKGIHLVLEVFAKIPRSAASLTILGEMQVPPETFARFADRVEHHPTVARRDVARFMAEADCLLFPSYFEGAGLVLYEALASGLGIIQSRNAAVVLPEDSELLMRALSEDELMRCVTAVIERPLLLEQQRAEGLAAVPAYTYDAYRARVAEIAGRV
ncbi:glycosyltransferase family 4 protein [Rhodoplanes sp. TEM]|uniref:Glycosyltransferase family 4 protein n=1 Tax=Rhodoplanes tepidamans TaxID=200616 RepID=A0ABT5JB61_RHOTP|nr:MULTISPECIES: glycosyltransferase family 4 protein [Rhodoplanes]MDC7786712.1 glycosyltransferase family 4 protein [Rhodoplanes tepidamans]MDC7983718.1 glycosyltransferase family 4 protein [Rhodoplanes sp. TEM]MDQ0358148.1 glycosyltransferase involved in cell wall biosynthesis [Rhodoplanes tepidamans]